MSEKKHKLELTDTEFMFMYTAIASLLEDMFHEYRGKMDYRGVVEMAQLALKMEPTFDKLAKEINAREAKRQQFEIESLLGGVMNAGSPKAN